MKITIKFEKEGYKRIIDDKTGISIVVPSDIGFEKAKDLLLKEIEKVKFVYSI